MQKTSGTTVLDQQRDHNHVNEIDTDDLHGDADNPITETTGTAWADPVHDAAGNMTKVPTSWWSAHYDLVWDAWNRLVEVKDGESTVAAYEHDGLGRRITETADSTTRHFYYSAAWQVLEERIGSSTGADRQFVWGARYIDDLVLRDRDTSEPKNGALNERLYALQDANFNVVALADTGGTIQERYLYSAYGTPSVSTGTFGSRGTSAYAWEYRYTARRYDLATGLYYYRNRPYHHELGRFLSRDPIGYGAGDANLYRYVRNNPLVFTDPRGLGPWAWVWTGEWNPPDYVWDAAMEGAGQYYLENSADTHHALQNIGKVDPTGLAVGTSKVLEAVEGDVLHQAAKQHGHLAPPPGAPPGGGGIIPPGLPIQPPGVPPLPPGLQPNPPVRPPAENCGQKFTELANDYGPVIIYGVGIAFQLSQGDEFWGPYCTPDEDLDAARGEFEDILDQRQHDAEELRRQLEQDPNNPLAPLWRQNKDRMLEEIARLQRILRDWPGGG